MSKSLNYKRRLSSEVKIGNTPLGAKNPIRVQSMTSTPTADVEASVAQCVRLAAAGAEYIRLTAQGIREAEAIGEIKKRLLEKGIKTPLVADIHFNPKAALAAAEVTDKVRINPGNYVDAARTFKKLHYTDEEYAAEIEKIERALIPFIEICKANSTAVRIGVNHGSLSDRIMSRYGDTPAGIVESAMEFLRVFVKYDFPDVVISIKASNTVVMVESVRRLIEAMEAENMHFPLHLGVTEAGDGDDGRIKSAVGIGTLLSEGIGDTIRVSLSEDPEKEIPAAKKMVKYIAQREFHSKIKDDLAEGYNYYAPELRESNRVDNIGGNALNVVVSYYFLGIEEMPLTSDYYYCANGIIPSGVSPRKLIIPLAAWHPKLSNEVSVITGIDEFDQLVECPATKKWLWVDASSNFNIRTLRNHPDIIVALYTSNMNIPASLQGMLHRMITEGIKNPVILRSSYPETDPEWLQIKAGIDLGAPVMNGFRDGIWLAAPYYSKKSDIVNFEFSILQAARARTSKTEYISCPSCGRTLFDLQATVAAVKAATAHLTHLKIGIMGCIVNGPGEMADADYGYVGASRGKVSLYKGKQCVEMNIPQEEAIGKLIALIKENGDWKEPES